MNKSTKFRMLKKVKLVPFRESGLLIALLLVAFVIFFKLEAFPNYFFCDEAIHGVEASHIMATGRSTDGEFLPLFVRGFGDFQLGLSVYAQIPITMVTGNSVESVRIRSGIFFILLCFNWALIARKVFGAKYYWLVPSILAGTPLLFLHARAGFEVLQAGSLFGIGLASIIAWGRLRVLTYGLVSVLAFAASFYSYIPARGWVLCAAVAFFVCFHRNLWIDRRQLLTICCFGLICILPAVIFLLVSPERFFARAQSVGFELFFELSKDKQLAQVASYLGTVLNPQFWFFDFDSFSNGPETRHLIPGLPIVLPIFILPVVIGLIIKGRSLLNREALFACLLFLLVPLPLVFSNVTPLRVFAMVLPIVGLICWGVLITLERAEKMSPLFARILGIAVLFIPIFLLRYSLGHAGQLYKDYRFYGIQYGSPQLYSEVKMLLDQDLSAQEALVSAARKLVHPGI